MGKIPSSAIRRSSDVGQSSMMVLAAVAVAAVVILAAGHLGSRVIDQARAQTAADAVALAAGAGGPAAADRVADANGAEIVSLALTETSVVAEVTVGDASAVAVASTQSRPPQWGSAMEAARVRAGEITGIELPTPTMAAGVWRVSVTEPVAMRLRDVTQESGLCPLGGRPVSLDFILCRWTGKR